MSLLIPKIQSVLQTVIVLAVKRLSNLRIDNFSNLVLIIISQMSDYGVDLVAKFNFIDSGLLFLIEIGNKLGLSKKQYGDLRGEGPKEVFKRMNNLL